MIRISRAGTGHVELADGPGLKRTQSRVESQRGDGRTPRQASSSKLCADTIRRGACAWTPNKRPLVVPRSLSSRAATQQRVGTQPHRTAASSASSRRSRRPASRPAGRLRRNLRRRGPGRTTGGGRRPRLGRSDPPGKTRAALDPLLREIATRGRWVSAHPDVILKMGVKEVLYRTRHLGWAADTASLRQRNALRTEFPRAFERAVHAYSSRTAVTEAKASGKWKPCRMLTHNCSGAPRAARQQTRGDATRRFIARCEPYFGWGGCIIDQAFQPRLPDGMIRCYMSGSKVAGIGHQLIKALIPPPPEGPDSPEAQPGPRIMYGPDASPFHPLRRLMEDEWTPQLMETLGIDEASLPVIWDADFPLRPARRGRRRHLCPLRNQREFMLRYPRRGAGGDSADGQGPPPADPRSEN